MTPNAIPALTPADDPPPPETDVEVEFEGDEELVGDEAGLPPYGQKSPPSGGSIHVRPSPSAMPVKSDWMVESVTLDDQMTKGAGEGVVSSVVQLGPREPMKVVLPMRSLFSMVKFLADVMAMP